MDEHSILELISHIRHDWLNRLQLIKGYLDLGRIDRVNTLIDEITRQCINESRLADLKWPKTSLFLFTYTWHSHPVSVKYEIQNRPRGNWENWDGCIYRFLEQFLGILNSTVSESSGHRLIIRMEYFENRVNLHFQFTGSLTSTGELETLLRSGVLPGLQTRVVNESQVSFDCCLQEAAV
jgi:hypothetical protein